MTRDEIYGLIVQILSDTFEVDSADITPEANIFEDLGLDSIDAIDIFVQLRDVTQRRPIPDEARVIRTVSELVVYVEKELAARDAGLPEPRPTTRAD